MAKFNCQGCGRIMSVPDQYAGKRVRCPGCQAAQRVPMPAAKTGEPEIELQAPVDLSGLDANEASGVRRLRQVLIGCGVCQKTIKIPESKLGKTAPCSACGVVLRVDAFNLAKAKGDLIDMTHLELEKADLLLDGGSHGSTLGGSSIQLDGSGMSGAGGTGGYELNVPPSGSMSGVSMPSNGQSQMRELRELNDLKHSGQITTQEYRERKKEIYAGKTLAIQAMSRSADGTGNRPVIKRDDKPALLPGPVKLLIALLILAGGGYAGWSVMNGPQSPPSESVAGKPPAVTASKTEVAGEERAPAEAAAKDESLALAEAEQTPASESMPADTALSETTEETVATTDLTDPSPDAAEAVPVILIDESVTMIEIEPEIGVVGEVTPEVDITPAVVMSIANWSTPWPAHTLDEDDRSAIGKACEVIQRMTVRDDNALIGVAVGPAAEDLDSPAYRGFRQSMTDILTDTARDDRVLDDLNIRSSERTAQLGTLESHRLHVTSKNNRDVRATILTGVQDGYSVSYWFAGSKTLYAEFLDTVGRAEFAPVQ